MWLGNSFISHVYGYNGKVYSKSKNNLLFIFWQEENKSYLNIL